MGPFRSPAAAAADLVMAVVCVGCRMVVLGYPSVLVRVSATYVGFFTSGGDSVST